MIEFCVFYNENGERYVVHGNDPGRFDRSLPPGREWDFPDEVQLIGLPLIKREKTREELSREGLVKVYRQYTPFAAKDIPLSRAIPKEFK
mgnify:CR=1 FL=1